MRRGLKWRVAQIDEGSRGFQGKMSFESGTSWVMGSQTVIWEEGARQRESKCKGLEMGASPRIQCPTGKICS